MTAQSERVPAELLEQFMNDGLPPEQENLLVQECLKGPPAILGSLLATTVHHKQRAKLACQEAEAKYEALLKAAQEPPASPAWFMTVSRSGDRGMVKSGSRSLYASFLPGVDPGALQRGATVLLNGPGNLIVGTAPEFPRTGDVATFSRMHGEHQAVLHDSAEREVTVDLADDLVRDGLSSGDLVVFDHESRVAWEKVERRHRSAGLLEELRLDVSIEQLGGMDEIFNELVEEVTLHLLYPERVARYRLGQAAAATFCGPPGTGKTSLVRALGRRLRETENVEIKAFAVPPGSHRSPYFGVSDNRIGDLFQEAKEWASQPGTYVLLFFDDLDHLGSRDTGIAGEIDARLLPRFLQEVDNLRGTRVMLIGATNREDLLDEALLRRGRFGRIFRIGRPNREQARQIFQRHLTPDLPLADHGAPSTQIAQELIEMAVSAAYAPNGEFATLATLTFRDGTRRPLLAAQVMSGALIAGVVEDAKRRVCFREMKGGPGGITAEDLSASLARELDAVAGRLKPGPGLSQMLNLPNDLDVVRVEPRRVPGAPTRAEYLDS